jgi:hypothetical protein
MKRILGLLPITVFANTVGVPSDLIPFLPTSMSIDSGQYPSCELPRGSSMYAAGVCVPDTNLTSLEFCGEFVNYAACVPPTNPLWPAWNARAKDELVKQLYETAVAERTQREQDSLTDSGYVPMLFTGNEACVNEYKRIVCLYNFPSCDSSTAIDSVSPTYGVCSERCNDYFTACKFDDSMITAYCENIDSEWPLSRADEPNITSSSSFLLDENVYECTGKNVESATCFLAIVVIGISVF